MTRSHRVADCTFASASRLSAPQQQHGLGLPFLRGCRAVVPPQSTELLSLLQRRCMAAPTCPAGACKAACQQAVAPLVYSQNVAAIERHGQASQLRCLLHNSTWVLGTLATTQHTVMLAATMAPDRFMFEAPPDADVGQRLICNAACRRLCSTDSVVT